MAYRVATYVSRRRMCSKPETHIVYIVGKTDSFGDVGFSVGHQGEESRHSKTSQNRIKKGMVIFYSRECSAVTATSVNAL